MVLRIQASVPEEKDVEWHSDRVALSADPDGLQDPGVSQLAADQLVLKHGWPLFTVGQMHRFMCDSAKSSNVQNVDGVPSYCLA